MSGGTAKGFFFPTERAKNDDGAVLMCGRALSEASIGCRALGAKHIGGHAVQGTEQSSRATVCSYARALKCPVLSYGTWLCTRYGKSGTDDVYCATRWRGQLSAMAVGRWRETVDRLQYQVKSATSLRAWYKCLVLT
eukprot:3358421-Rhodomonas_salina.6